MDEVRKHIGRTYFAWIGGTDERSVFYYRIHSPVILIEFDHQPPAGLRNLHDPQSPTGAHPRGDPHAQRQRLRQGSAAPALRAAQAHGLNGVHYLTRFECAHILDRDIEQSRPGLACRPCDMRRHDAVLR